jgi:hypothetical protein
MNRIDTVSVGKTATSGASLTSVFPCRLFIAAKAEPTEFR